jgi:hypothetical protein
MYASVGKAVSTLAGKIVTSEFSPRTIAAEGLRVETVTRDGNFLIFQLNFRHYSNIK